jgi:hypothetical protein
VQGIQRPNMIDVGMGQHNTHNRQPQLARALYNWPGLARWPGGVNERKAIILAHQIAVDEAQVIKLEKVLSSSGYFHVMFYPLAYSLYLC